MPSVRTNFYPLDRPLVRRFRRGEYEHSTLFVALLSLRSIEKRVRRKFNWTNESMEIPTMDEVELKGTRR